jgi:hypothetical protein
MGVNINNLRIRDNAKNLPIVCPWGKNAWCELTCAMNTIVEKDGKRQLLLACGGVPLYFDIDEESNNTYVPEGWNCHDRETVAESQSGITITAT